MTGRRGALVAGVAVAVALIAGCGVEVPDDVADRATSTAPTTAPAPSTTEAPTSDDELEQALLDNGYTVGESECGAEALREELDEDQIDEIIGADSVEDIDPSSAADFADAIGGCLDEEDDGGSGPGRGPGG